MSQRSFEEAKIREGSNHRVFTTKIAVDLPKAKHSVERFLQDNRIASTALPEQDEYSWSGIVVRDTWSRRARRHRQNPSDNTLIDADVLFRFEVSLEPGELAELSFTADALNADRVEEFTELSLSLFNSLKRALLNSNESSMHDG